MTSERAGKTRQLRAEDRALWERVRETVIPLHPKRRVPEAAFAQIDSAPDESSDAKTARAPARPASAPKNAGQRATRDPVRSKTGSTIDKPVVRKLARGRLGIDARIDLHDMTQDEARLRLSRFLSDARARGMRHVLVITGKGRSPASEGTLKRMVPYWLKTPPLSECVSGYSVSARHHGGDGALYVRLRKTGRARL